MKKKDNLTKSKISVITIILVLIFSSILTIIPAIAQEPPRKKTYAYIGATPNPIGINQEVLLHVGITDYLYVVTDGWEGLTVTVTTPDGQTQTLGPFRTDATGGTGTLYTPTMQGVYTFQTHFPEQTYNWVVPPLFDPQLIGPIIYEASDSETLELVVQEQQREYYPGSPLPTEYWTRPIDAQHREWSTISGNWLAGLSTQFTRTTYDFIAPHTEGPETAHILWAKPIGVHGGLVGAEVGTHSYEHGGAYEGKWWPPVIINGVVYYNRFEDRGGSNVEQEIVATDLRTGEEIWTRNWDNKRLDFGQLFYWDSYNYHGTFAYLWAVESSFDFATFSFVNTWHAYDAGTGRWVYSMENVPGFGFGSTGYPIRGTKGEIYIYTIDQNDGWITLWNSSRVVSSQGSWRPHGNVYENASERGQEWNVSIPTGLSGSVEQVFYGERMIGSNSTGWGGIGEQTIEIWSLNLKPGKEGELLFQETWQPPVDDVSINWGTASIEDGVFTMGLKETRQWYGFNINTGQQIWGPTESEPYLNMLVFGGGGIAYGKFFTIGMSGEVNAYNASTGEHLWSFDVVDPYTEILWSDNWPINLAFAADGKIYLYFTEHSPINPLARGGPFVCLNEDGEKLWSIPFYQSSWAQNPAIADGIIVNLNSYDNRIYAIGKGPTATTIKAPLVSIPKGSGVTIQGTVTDISGGTENSDLKARFPNGVPAIADESMTEWMKYVYMQFERPEDAVGVPVKIQIVDPNNEYAWIGTATTDLYGNFGFTWKPQMEGQYTIIATFDGSKSYWGSTSTTYLSVDPAPPTDPGYQGPSAQEVANKVIASLPDGPTPDQIAQAVMDQMPEYPETPEMPQVAQIPDIANMNIIIIVAIAIAIIIGLLSLVSLFRKK